jgi:hypothetical protein
MYFESFESRIYASLKVVEGPAFPNKLNGTVGAGNFGFVFLNRVLLTSEDGEPEVVDDLDETIG